MRRLRLATRASELALAQACIVADALCAAHAGLEVEMVEVSTRGDRDRSRPIESLGGVGVFTKEIESALCDGRADVAVHSLKDLPVEIDTRFALAAVPVRADARDALVGGALENLPEGARVGTSSARRAAQLLAIRPRLSVVPVRGNVPTRIAKVDAGELDALVVAMAALDRLDLAGRGVALDADAMLPAPGQGALAVECLADDAETVALVRAVDDSPSRAAVEAERACLAALGGGCRAPIGALATSEAGGFALRACVLSPDGRTRLDAKHSGPADRAEALGRSVAEKLLARGAREVLDAARG